MKNLLGVSLFTLACLYGMLCAVVFLVCILCGIDLGVVILVSILVLVIQFLISPFLTDLSMKWFYKARFDYQMPEYLVQFINQVCQANNMKYPKIGFIDDGGPNAFTYGHTKNDARIVLTRGIFERLTPAEVQTVVAHELGHAVHYDMALMTFAQLVPLVLYYIYEIFTSNVDDDDNAKLAIVGIIAYVFYVISQYVILWFSRVREYYADDFAINVTKNPSGLGEALVKVAYGLGISSSHAGKASVSKKNTLGIFDTNASKSLTITSYSGAQINKQRILDAMKWEMWNVWAKWYELHSTHPNVSKRLKTISDRCPEFGQPKYIDFNLQQTESYWDDFFGELFILGLPWITIIGMIVLMIFLVELGKDIDVLTCCCAIVAGLCVAHLIKLSFTHKDKDYKETKVSALLGEVKVSGVTAIPCQLSGVIIGRGDPGCIFSEDLVLQDETGIIFLDYKRVFRIMDKLTALFNNKKFMNKRVKITGWYRRSPVPYVEIKQIEYEGDGTVDKMKSFAVNKFITWFFLIGSVALIVMNIIG